MRFWQSFRQSRKYAVRRVPTRDISTDLREAGEAAGEAEAEATLAEVGSSS
jgi:hypothetical protein